MKISLHLCFDIHSFITKFNEMKSCFYYTYYTNLVPHELQNLAPGVPTFVPHSEQNLGPADDDAAGVDAGAGAGVCWTGGSPPITSLSPWPYDLNEANAPPEAP